jgi:hypothetical protein
VPLIVDGRRQALEGSLHRVPKPALWPWVAVIAALLAASAVVVLRTRGDATRSGAITLAVIAAACTVLLAIAFALDAYASPGTWIASFDEVFFALVGLGVFVRAPERWHIPSAIGLALLSVGVGISKGAIFFHPIVLAILPGAVVRSFAAAAIGGGLAAAVIGAGLYAGAPAGHSTRQA